MANIPQYKPSDASGNTDENGKSADGASTGIQTTNPERKARKEAQKAVKAAEAAKKKALKQQQSQQQQQTTASSSSSSSKPSEASSSSSSSKKPHRLDPRSQSPEVQLSKSLAYILRHGALKEGLEIRPDGYINLQDVLNRPRVKSVNMAEKEGGKRKPELQDVQNIVASNDKQRFEIKEERDTWYIRAVQGHSIKQVTELEHVPLTLDNLYLLRPGVKFPDSNTEQEREDLAEHLDYTHLGGVDEHDQKYVIHGTNPKAWESILDSGGLKPMTRNHIHLAKGKFGEEGVISGMRKTSSRLIFVDIRKALADGIEFSLSSNGVVLTPGDRESGVLHLKYFAKVEDQQGNTIWTPTTPANQNSST